MKGGPFYAGSMLDTERRNPAQAPKILEPVAPVTGRSLWSRADWYALAGVSALAALLRVPGLGTPGRLVFDEAYYAQEACWYVQETPCGIDGEVNFMHPPLGKWIMGGSIEIFGFEPWAWRLPVALAGILSVILLYVAARRLLGSTFGATLAAGFLAVDLLHLVHSRIGMLDIFVTMFGVAVITCAVFVRDAMERSDARAATRWRVACGICGGAAVATKWSGVFFLVLALGLVVFWEARSEGGRARWTGAWEVVRKRFLGLAFAFVVLPLLVYAATFVGRIEGEVFALPWEEGSVVRSFLGRQKAMLLFHLGLDGPQFPYASSALEWPLLKRPLAYYFVDEGGEFREILATGDPLLWWTSLAALGACAWSSFRRRRVTDGVLVAVGGFAMTYLPWLVLTTSRSATFLFYMLPTVPFMCLGLAAFIHSHMDRRGRRLVVAGYLAVVATSFVFFYPVVTAQPLSEGQWRARMIFKDCQIDPEVWDEFVRSESDYIRRAGVGIPSSPAADTPAISPLAPPPDGWCWI